MLSHVHVYSVSLQQNVVVLFVQSDFLYEKKLIGDGHVSGQALQCRYANYKIATISQCAREKTLAICRYKIAIQEAQKRQKQFDEASAKQRSQVRKAEMWSSRMAAPSYASRLSQRVQPTQQCSINIQTYEEAQTTFTSTTVDYRQTRWFT